MDIDWKGIVRGVAPTLGAALGGPMAGIAIKFIADSVLGLPDGATPTDVSTAILSSTPEMLLKLKQSDRDFDVKMKQLDIDVFKLEVKDKDSARRLFSVNIWPQITLSVIFVTGYIYVVALFLVGDISIPAELKSEFAIVLGVLTAGMANILQFWFGSSYGSKEKTKQLGNVGRG
jgi:hypothetical protein